MSMQELTDDQLDGLFRKSAEEFDPPYDPAAWEALSNELDDRDRRVFWKRWLPWGIPVLLLLLIGGTWYAYHKSTSAANQAVSKLVVRSNPAGAENPAQRVTDSPLTQTESVNMPPVGLPKASETKKEAEPDKLGNPGSEPARPTERVDKPTVEPGRNTAFDATKRSVPTYKAETRGERTIRKEAMATSYSNPLVVSDKLRSNRLHRNEKGVSAQLDKKAKLTRKQRVRHQNFGNASELAYAVPSTKSLKENGSTPEVETVPPAATGEPLSVEVSENGPVSLPGIAGLLIRPGQWPKLAGLADRQVTQPEQAEPVVVPKAPPYRGLSIRLAVAPDLSSIGLQNFSKPGTNVGVLLEYRLASRWSVQAGVIRSTKVYQASTSQYNGELYWSKWTVKPEGISGQCNILDIPLNLRYDVALLPRMDNRLQPSRWFVSGGITSYVMLQEDYTYNYADPTNIHIYPNMRQLSTKTGGYGFSQMNLSVGYERALSRRLSWQVEPFMKVPLKGVGFYKINLLSTGAFLSLRYKL